MSQQMGFPLVFIRDCRELVCIRVKALADAFLVVGISSLLGLFLMTILSSQDFWVMYLGLFPLFLSLFGVLICDFIFCLAHGSHDHPQK